MVAIPNRVEFKASDIWDTPEDGNRYEVIDGDLYMTPPPSFGHQLAVSRLMIKLGQHVAERGLGYLLTSPIGIVLDAGTGVQPDIVYVSQARAEIISERGLEGAPDLVVEAISPGTASRDRGVKMRRYAAAGIPHYWIVDPRSRTLEEFRLTQNGYELLTATHAEGVFEPELFPGLSIALSDLWV